MQILNIAGYKFVPLIGLTELRQQLLNHCEALQLKGTILLSHEGINISLSGPIPAIESFTSFLKTNDCFQDMTFRESYSDSPAFKRLKVKIKKEIITMRRKEICPQNKTAPCISPEEFKRWMDENHDITILDTRNDYEVRFGTFENAVNLGMKDFSEFPEVAKQLTPNKPVVMFCTGGIRCEKASLHLLNEGFAEVYQLEGGILNYFAKMGGAHYDGDCFVFDERVALNPELAMSGVKQCVNCQGPLKQIRCECISH